MKPFLDLVRLDPSGKRVARKGMANSTILISEVE